MSDSLVPNTKDVLSSTLTNLERVIEVKFFFLFSAFIFAMDCGINFLTKKSLYTIGTGINFANLDWGKFLVFLLVFLLVFSFLMALAWKLMYAVMQAFIRIPVITFVVWVRGLLIQEEYLKSDQLAFNKSPWEAMRLALDRNDSLLYEVAKTELERYSAKWQNKIANAQMAFSTLCFMILDQFVFGDAITPTLLRQFSMWSHNQTGLYSLLIYGFWGMVILLWFWEAFVVEVEYARVYVPSLK